MWTEDFKCIFWMYLHISLGGKVAESGHLEDISTNLRQRNIKPVNTVSDEPRWSSWGSRPNEAPLPAAASGSAITADIDTLPREKSLRSHGVGDTAPQWSLCLAFAHQQIHLRPEETKCCAGPRSHCPNQAPSFLGPFKSRGMRKSHIQDDTTGIRQGRLQLKEIWGKLWQREAKNIPKEQEKGNQTLFQDFYDIRLSSYWSGITVGRHESIFNVFGLRFPLVVGGGVSCLHL